jgi:serine/threonine protein kinase
MTRKNHKGAKAASSSRRRGRKAAAVQNGGDILVCGAAGCYVKNDAKTPLAGICVSSDPSKVYKLFGLNNADGKDHSKRYENEFYNAQFIREKVQHLERYNMCVPYADPSHKFCEVTLKNRAYYALVSDFVRGETMRSYFGGNKQRRMTLGAFFAYMFPVFTAVNALNAQGICHNDINMNNIMIDPDNNYKCTLVDFGLSQPYDDLWEYKVNDTLGYVYYAWPPECHIYYSNFIETGKDPLTDDDEMDAYLDMYVDQYDKNTKLLTAEVDPFKLELEKVMKPVAVKLVRKEQAAFEQYSNKIDVFSLGIVFREFAHRVRHQATYSSVERRILKLVDNMVKVDPDERCDMRACYKEAAAILAAAEKAGAMCTVQ